MKKLLGIMMAVAMVAGLAAAEAVYSQNVVGYVKVDLPQDELVLLSTPFIATNTVQSLFGDLPNGSEIYFWDNGWTVAAKTARGGWGPHEETVIELGSSVFVRAPEESSVVMSGDILMDEEFPLQSQEGLTMFSFPYAAEVEWQDLTLASDAEDGASLYVWGPAGWSQFVKTARGGWGPGAELIMELGKGYFFESTVDGERIEVRPFDPSEW